MSKYVERFTTQSNINARLKKLWSNEKLTAVQIQLLNEYQTLRWNDDEAFLRGCAEEAINELNSTNYNNELILTEWWASFKTILERRYHHDDSHANRIEKEFLDKLANANKEFVEKWDELRKKNLKKREQVWVIDDQIATFQALIDENRYLFSTIQTVVNMLKEDWFEIQNPELLNMTNSEIIQGWMTIVWINKEWVEKEISFLPDWWIYTHVEHPDWLGACEELSGQLNNQISNVIWDLSESCWAPVFLQTKKSWIWRWEKKPILITAQDNWIEPTVNTDQRLNT